MAPRRIGELTHLSPDQEGASALAELLCALSFASGLALGDRMEHGIGTAYIGLRLADALRLDDEEREAVYYGALIKDAGCTSCSSLFATVFSADMVLPLSAFRMVDQTQLPQVLRWMARTLPADASLPARAAKLLTVMTTCGSVLSEAKSSHCEIAEMFARRLGFGSHVQQAVRFQAERWDGKGVFKQKGANTPMAARVLALAQVTELCKSFGGKNWVVQKLQEGRGSRFDPDLTAALMGLAGDGDLCEQLESDSLPEHAIDMRPSTSAELRTPKAVEQVCEVLADFVDARTSRRAHHSTWVAQRSVAIARRMGLSQHLQGRIRRAALLHDLGIVAVPLAVVDKQDGLTEAERDQLHLHSYYTERVLERVRPLQHLAFEASAEHEWLDGTGYHRRIRGEQIPLTSRIVAVADTFTVLTAPPGLTDPSDVMAQLRAGAGTQFDPACCEALDQELTNAPTLGGPPGSFLASAPLLTEREIEVMQLLALGLSNPQIADKLVISKKTVEHHLEHIYDKLNISSRTSAVAYAIHHGLS